MPWNPPPNHKSLMKQMKFGTGQKVTFGQLVNLNFKLIQTIKHLKNFLTNQLLKVFNVLTGFFILLLLLFLLKLYSTHVLNRVVWH